MTVSETWVVRGKGLALVVVRMLSKFDHPRGKQVPETVIRISGDQDSELQDGRLKIVSNDSTLWPHAQGQANRGKIIPT